jgi:PIN domain nuclease of toxin-antitoxin system
MTLRRKYVVDTHALLWHLIGDPRLGTNAAIVLADPANDLIVPATALGEAAWILEHHPGYALTPAALLGDVAGDPRTEVMPLTDAVVAPTLSLTSIREMHDRQIVATALILADAGTLTALVTRDQNITLSGLVPVVW